MATVTPVVFPPQPVPDPFPSPRSSSSSQSAALIVILAAQPRTPEDNGVDYDDDDGFSPLRARATRSAPCSARKSVSLDCEAAVAGFFNQAPGEEEDCHSASEDRPSPLPTKGLIRKFRKRILSTDKAPAQQSNCPLPSPSAVPCNSYSPRSRPLYVDTAHQQQSSNSQDLLKRRSPVSQVVDFVRGRHRTYSLQLGSSPMMTSPASVAARSSASCDTAPSPGIAGRRQTVSGGGTRIHRASFTGGMRSFDSGLDLSSPTINHTALLIKEASLFSSFDSMSIGGTAVPDINAIFFDNHDAVYSLFMKAHKCYDLIPTSSKLVVFDTHLTVRKAFYALVYNGVRAAPLWDTDSQRFSGMLTITDFIKILCKHYEQGDNAERMRALEDQQISHWREQFENDGSLRPFIHIDPNESLHRAVEVLCESKVHRLPVLDTKTGNITYILTHKRIMKFLSLYMRDLPRPSFMSCTPRELGIGAWGDILCCHVDTPIHDALELFLKNRVSALPLVDENGRVVDIYAKFDVISLAAENSYDKLDCTVHEALQHRSEWFEGVQTCLETDSLFHVLEAIVKAEVHRLIVTDQDRKCVGVVSLSDILKYLVLDPCQKPPAPPSRNASGTSTGGSTDSPPHSIPEGVEIDDDETDLIAPPSSSKP